MPDAGEVRLRGATTAFLSMGLGFRPDLTGYENMEMGLTLIGVPSREFAEKRRSVEQFTQLGRFLDVPTSTYSAGMRARLAFAIATCVEPEILIMDEAIGAGDEQFREAADERLKHLMTKARAIIVCTHSLPKVKDQATRVMWIEGGRVVPDRRPGRGGHGLPEVRPPAPQRPGLRAAGAGRTDARYVGHEGPTMKAITRMSQRVMDGLRRQRQRVRRLGLDLEVRDDLTVWDDRASARVVVDLLREIGLEPAKLVRPTGRPDRHDTVLPVVDERALAAEVAKKGPLTLLAGGSAGTDGPVDGFCRQLEALAGTERLASLPMRHAVSLVERVEYEPHRVLVNGMPGAGNILLQRLVQLMQESIKTPATNQRETLLGMLAWDYREALFAPIHDLVTELYPEADTHLKLIGRDVVTRGVVVGSASYVERSDAGQFDPRAAAGRRPGRADVPARNAPRDARTVARRSDGALPASRISGRDDPPPPAGPDRLDRRQVHDASRSDA